MRIKVLGAGSWGTALAILLFSNGHTVSLWSWQESHVADLITRRENTAFLPGAAIPKTVSVSTDLTDSGDYDMLVFAVPSGALSEVCQKVKPFLNPRSLLVNTAKGFETGTQKRLSEVIRAELNAPLVVLSGPSHAEEVARFLPTTIVAASENQENNRVVQDVFMNDLFRVYTNTDLAGVEVGGAVKNVIAIGTGLAEGLGLGDNARAALITRGLSEIIRLGVALGGRLATFSGLTGLGDLVVTCGSMHSRNRRAGIAIGQGIPIDKVLDDMGMVVEGFYSTESAYRLAARLNVEMPITEQIYQVLYNSLPPREAIFNLMTREKKQEYQSD